ncbi:MAG: response regulator [Xanthomonadales bacterium]|nr:response regulator [Xanthomonadales bacterium]NIX11780.1 response regulator [Xanthomonadales bacterium]
MSYNKSAVILVEPDEAVRSALTTLLKSRGFQVTALENGHDLAQLIESGAPLAIISESGLPDMTAVAVLDMSRSHRIPVIFLGHQQEVQNAVDLMRMGARDFLEKPFPQRRLLDLLDGLALENIA